MREGDVGEGPNDVLYPPQPNRRRGGAGRNRGCGNPHGSRMRRARLKWIQQGDTWVDGRTMEKVSRRYTGGGPSVHMQGLPRPHGPLQNPRRVCRLPGTGEATGIPFELQRQTPTKRWTHDGGAGEALQDGPPNILCESCRRSSVPRSHVHQSVGACRCNATDTPVPSPAPGIRQTPRGFCSDS